MARRAAEERAMGCGVGAEDVGAGTHVEVDMGIVEAEIVDYAPAKGSEGAIFQGGVQLRNA